MRGKQSVKKGVWYIGGEKRRYIKKQRGKEIPFGLNASAAAPFLVEVVKSLFKKIFSGRRRRRRR